MQQNDLSCLLLFKVLPKFYLNAGGNSSPTLNFHKLFFQNPRFIIILLLQEGQESSEEGVKLMETFLQVLNNVIHWKTNLHCVNYYIALPWVPEVIFFQARR